MRACSKHLAVLIMAASGALLRGQSSDSTILGDPAAAPGSPASSYALSGIDHINYYNGLVNTEIPVLTVGGRGSASQSITIPIQRQWGVSNYSGSYTPGTNQWPILAGLYTSGYLSIQSVSGTTDACYSNGQWEGGGPYVTYVVWTSFDGTQTFLKDTKSDGQEQGAGVNSCSGLQSYTQYDRGRTFRSTDGSGLTFLSDNDIVDQGSNSISGALLTRDGTKIRFSADGYVSQVEDRNGNLINISWQSTANGGIYTFTDPIGRTSTINYTEDLNTDTQDVITYPGYDGASRTIQVNYAPLGSTLASGSLATYQCLFPELNGASSSTQFNPRVISSVVLADGTEYGMKYNAYGELAQLTLPTGGHYTYSYSEAGCSANGGSGVIALQNNSGYRIWRPLRERDEYADGVHLSAKLVLTYPGGQSPDPNHPSRPLSEALADLEDATSNILRQELHYFYGDPASTQAPPSDPVSFASWWEGLEAQTDITDGNYNVKQVQQQVYRQRSCGTGETCWFDPQADTSPAHDPQLCQTATTFDSSVTSGMLYAYDQYNNVTDKWEYDYGLAPAVGGSCPATAPSNYLRHTNTAYLGGGYLDPSVNLVGLPALVTVDQGGTAASETHFGYDETSVANAPNIAGHDNANYAGNGLRGNLTNPAQCLNPPNCSSWLNHPMVYDIAGNVVSAADGNGNTTTFSYSDANNSYAHPTSITNALGQSVSNQYDYGSGKLVAAMDLNGVNTLYSYNDALERLTQVRRASGGGLRLESQTNYVYPNPNWAVAYQDENSTGDGAMQTQSVYDGLGRLTESRVMENGAEKYISSFTTYDALGRVSTTDNPTRVSNGSYDGLGFPTSYSYDALNRVMQVQMQDGATSATSYSGNQVTATDAAGKKRQLVYDAAGRLKAVYEDPGGLLNYGTNYGYDALDNLSWVSQGNCPSCQGRAFHYYGTGWLKDASNGESGVTSYTYDNAGNVKTRTDNRNIVTTYSYDALNRLTAKQYSDGVTPTVGLAYDGSGNVAYGKGHLVWMSDGTSATTFANFDALGRVTQSYQQMAGQTYNFGYNWNLANGLTSETYPSGRVLTTTFDAANRPQAVSGTLGSLTTPYASGVSYAPHGGPAKYEFGNHIWRSFTYTSRLQPNCWWDAVNDSPSAYLLTLCPGWGTTNNNGTLQSMTVQAGGPGPLSSLPTFSTNYSYDNVNRVSSASDTGGWSRSFHYDQYGNLWTTGASGTPISGLMPTANVYNGNNQITGNSYDGAGNLTGLGTYTLVYDAENRLTQATDAPSAGGGSVQYFYDAGGQRVMRQFAGGARTVYVYDALGQMAAEYSSAAADTVTPACGTCYLTTDHLGSTRLVTDADGNVVARHDYLPFGEEVPAGSAGRGAPWGAFDSVSQKFTGQERDSETGLDFFQARHFSNVLGRFLSADPGNAGADLTDPQTWNGYSYVRNNPLALVDPSGMDATDSGDDCFSDPTCGGGIGWPFPPIDFPWPTSMPIPPPPPQPSPTVIQNAGGAYGQGQWGSYPNDGETLGLPTGMSVPGPLSPQVLLNLWDWDCSTGVCVPGFGGEGAVSPFAVQRSGFGSCLNKAFGVGGFAAGSSTLGSLPTVATRMKIGESPTWGTSPLSLLSRSLFPQKIPSTWAPTVGNLGARSGTLGGVVGRWTGWLGLAVTAYQTGEFISCMNTSGNTGEVFGGAGASGNWIF